MKQVPSVYNCKIGDIVVTALCDGYLDTTYEILNGITTQEGERVMSQARLPSPPRISVNAYLIRSGGRTALIEAGSGNSMGPTLGHLPDNIRAAGLDPKDLDTVLLTHMHPDHSNGLTDADGGRVFPNAEILLSANELNHWLDDGEMARAPERKKERYFRAARRQVAAYGDQFRPFTGSGEVFPGVVAEPIPGHTPGHTAYLVTSGRDALMIWGDTVHVPAIQIAYPDVTLDFDSDADMARAMRRKLFAKVSHDEMLVAGMHLDFPGFGRLGQEREGYRYYPQPWNPLL